MEAVFLVVWLVLGIAALPVVLMLTLAAGIMLIGGD